MSTQDAISAEEQRQIDEAIALSLGDSSQTRVLATTSTSISTSTKQQPGRGADLPILLDDDSSSDIEPVTQGRGNSKPVLKNVGESGDAIASSKKKVPRNDPLSEVDTSATEEDSDVEQPTLPASISLKHKTDDEIDAIDVTRTSKKAKYVTDEPNYATEADEGEYRVWFVDIRTSLYHLYFWPSLCYRFKAAAQYPKPHGQYEPVSIHTRWYGQGRNGEAAPGESRCASSSTAGK